MKKINWKKTFLKSSLWSLLTVCLINSLWVFNTGYPLDAFLDLILSSFFWIPYFVVFAIIFIMNSKKNEKTKDKFGKKIIFFISLIFNIFTWYITFKYIGIDEKDLSGVSILDGFLVLAHILSIILVPINIIISYFLIQYWNKIKNLEKKISKMERPRRKKSIFDVDDFSE